MPNDFYNNTTPDQRFILNIVGRLLLILRLGAYLSALTLVIGYLYF